MAYDVLLAREAEKDLAKVPATHVRLVLKALDALRVDPFIGKPLQGALRGYYSHRAWPFRIIYRIEKKKLIVYVLSIPHRKDAYR